ncbi:MAG: hypothetical protein EOO40_01860 [Deltaproteobacteria bacterium]|nr:MAG: hypothetical protein EOO40_01860 [Deltaproteobacteria bacterium]
MTPKDAARLTWPDYLRAAINRYVGADERLAHIEALDPTSPKVLRQRKMVLQELAALRRVLQRCEQGAYEGRPSKSIVPTLVLAALAIHLRQSELRQAPALESTRDTLMWFVAALDRAGDKKLQPASTSWIGLTQALIDSLRGCEKALEQSPARDKEAATAALYDCLTQLEEQLDDLPQALQNADFRDLNGRLSTMVRLRRQEVGRLT